MINLYNFYFEVERTGAQRRKVICSRLLSYDWKQGLLISGPVLFPLSSYIRQQESSVSLTEHLQMPPPTLSAPGPTFRKRPSQTVLLLVALSHPSTQHPFLLGHSWHSGLSCRSVSHGVGLHRTILSSVSLLAPLHLPPSNPLLSLKFSLLHTHIHQSPNFWKQHSEPNIESFDIVFLPSKVLGKRNFSGCKAT